MRKLFYFLAVLFHLSSIVLADPLLPGEWSWVFVQTGSRAIVLQGTAKVEKMGDEFRAILKEEAGQLNPSFVRGKLQNGMVSGVVTLSHSSDDGFLLKEGRWTSTLTNGGSTETIWLLDPEFGNYLVITRWLRK